jgi:DNA-binding MarR family transcriptional regulator
MSETSPLTNLILQGMDKIIYRTIREHRRFARTAGISTAQYTLLMQLYYQRRCAISDISFAMNITNAAASQQVDRLVVLGLLNRTEDPVDRRVKQLELTGRGHELVESGLRLRHSLVRELITGLTPIERESVGAGMEVIARVFDQVPDHEGPKADLTIAKEPDRHD